MLLKIILGLAVVIIAFLVVAAMRPSSFRIERSATIAAPAPEIFARVDDLHAFQEWSPWAKLDPNCQTSFDGPPAGKGAAYSWSGNSKVGQGRMTVVESRPSDLIRMKLEFLKPFPGTNSVEFAFKPEADRTLVTWTMTGQYAFIPKAIGMIINMDQMIGKSFDEGLANLKTLSEQRPAGGVVTSR